MRKLDNFVRLDFLSSYIIFIYVLPLFAEGSPLSVARGQLEIRRRYLRICTILKWTEKEITSQTSLYSLVPKEANKNATSDEEPSHSKKIRSSSEDSKNINAESKEDAKSSAVYDAPSTPGSYEDSPSTLSPVNTSPLTPDPFNEDVRCQ